MADLKLYDLELSGNCYKIRLMMSFLGLEYEKIPVDLMAGEHKSAPYLEINPFGQVPTLQDGDITLRDSHAMLIYLNGKYGDERWFPNDPLAQARIMEWLTVSANEIARGPFDARLHDLFGLPLDVETAREKAHAILTLMDQHLDGRDWLAADHCTIADIACFGYVPLSGEGGIPLDPYKNICAWMNRIKAMPNFIPMPGQWSN